MDAMRTHYRFGSTWIVTSSTDAVRALLEDVRGYGAWWPGVRVVEDVSSATRRAARLEVRAPIGYRIRITIIESLTADDELRVLMRGDLHGWCMWRMVPVRGGTRVAFAQEVEAQSRPLRLASPVFHHMLAAQHERIMQAAETGMRRALGEVPADPA